MSAAPNDEPPVASDEPPVASGREPERAFGATGQS